MNEVFLSGNLLEDPSELREIAGKLGTFAVKTFRMAHNQGKDKPLIITVDLYDGWAKNCRAKKGDGVVVRGTLTQSYYEKDGKQTSTYFLKGREVRLLVPKPQDEPTA